MPSTSPMGWAQPGESDTVAFQTFSQTTTGWSHRQQCIRDSSARPEHLSELSGNLALDWHQPLTYLYNFYKMGTQEKQLNTGTWELGARATVKASSGILYLT